MKKKLVNNIFFIFFIYCSVACANIDINQGDNISEDFSSKIYIGMTKNEVLKNFGNPVLTTNCDVDFFCYYYYYLPLDKSISIKYNYILMFFNESLLVSYFFRL